jgi:U3 small nucleolar RNA-associated protein 13
VAVHNDQNILFHHISPDYSSTLIRQIIGFNDEIIDALFLSPSHTDSHLALATNSALVRVYDTATWDARLIKGHADVVLCLARSSDGTWLATGSKDNTARVWESVGGEWRCKVVCQGHAESVGAVVMSRRERERFLITASQDRTVKMWDLSTVMSDITADPATPSSLTTLRIHDKDINALDVSPNDQFLVSGSQDKLVKVFAIDYSVTANKPASGAIRLLGTCKGHKRGVWSVKFSPTDRVVASGAADRTIRLWSLDDFSCLKVGQWALSYKYYVLKRPAGADFRGAHKFCSPCRLLDYGYAARVNSV